MYGIEHMNRGTGPRIILAGMRVRIHRFLAGLTSPLGADITFDVDLDDESPAPLRPLPRPGGTFDARVIKVYGNHPTDPTRYELRVVREDTGDEHYCPLSSVVSILPTESGVASGPYRLLSESGRHRARLLDAICGPDLDLEDSEEIPEPPPLHLHVRIPSGPIGPDELAVEL